MKSPYFLHAKRMAKSFAMSLLSIGIDPRRLRYLVYVPKYIVQARRFKSLGGEITSHSVVLSDYTEQAGATSGHYFHQDLLVASFIHQASPERHIDIGSRIDGFVAHVATFRTIEVMDVRKLDNAGHENISFLQADLMNPNNAKEAITDSLSCLHAIEHFGLGRYGDPLDPKGHVRGFNNMLRMLKSGGIFYISFPIGLANEVHFNAHRVFHPLDIFNWADDKQALRLERFDYVDDRGALHQKVDIHANTPQVEFGCGIYSFIKT